MSESFRTEMVYVEGVRTEARVAGSGPPLPHSSPRTHATGHLEAPELAEGFEDRSCRNPEYRSSTRRRVAL